MDNYQSLWSKCQELIRQNVAPHVYDVWFKDIVCERYDEERKTVVLRVPSRYVVEYIEEIHVPLMKCVLNKCFGSSVSLNYRLKNKPSSPVSFLREAGNCQNRVHISIPNARERLEAGLHHFLGDKAQWLPAYDKVAEWLTDNKGRGLLLLQRRLHRCCSCLWASDAGVSGIGQPVPALESRCGQWSSWRPCQEGGPPGKCRRCQSRRAVLWRSAL